MSNVIVITSGKGGTGKTSLTAGVGSCLAALGKQVLCIDMDVGLRNLDLSLGLSDRALMDFTDVLCGRCTLERAAVPHPVVHGLNLLTAPVTLPRQPLSRAAMQELLRQARERYDFILMDSPAGFGKGFRIGAAAAELALLVVTPDPVCVRDGYLASVALEQRGIKGQRLLINRVRQQYVKSELPDLDTVIDQTGVQLIGVVPEDIWVMKAAARGVPLPSGSKALPAYQNIAKRLLGQYCPLAVG